MRKIIEKILFILARMIIKKYQPKIIGITGSIGKTSTKEAAFSVLQSHFRVRQTDKNYNNEIGLPLTIIGAASGGRSLIGWMKVVMKAFSLLLMEDKTYPEVLILEMGADKPGDIEYLTTIAPCDIGVVTKVAPVHIEFFGSVEKIAAEKRKIVSHLNKDGIAILNFDDETVLGMAKGLKSSVLSFGYTENADVHAVDLERQGSVDDLPGVKFKLLYDGSAVPVFLPRVLGQHQTYAALAAAAIGIAMKLNLIDIANGLQSYIAPKGRMNLVPGINNSLIVDDTYNSSPEAAMAAVKAIAELNLDNATRKVAIMGDMLELGDITDQAHYDLGRTVAESKFDILVAVGINRLATIRGAQEAGMENFLDFENSIIAAEKMKELIVGHEVILVKGSQGSRMERVVKSLMREPERAKELLVRQSDEWLKK